MYTKLDDSSKPKGQTVVGPGVPWLKRKGANHASEQLREENASGLVSNTSTRVIAGVAMALVVGIYCGSSMSLPRLQGNNTDAIRTNVTSSITYDLSASAPATPRAARK